MNSSKKIITPIGDKQLEELYKSTRKTSSKKLLGLAGTKLFNKIKPIADYSYKPKDIGVSSRKMVRRYNKKYGKKYGKVKLKHIKHTADSMSNPSTVYLTKRGDSITGHELGHIQATQKLSDKNKLRSLKAYTWSLGSGPVAIGAVTGALVGKKMAKDDLAGKKTKKRIKYLPEMVSGALSSPFMVEELGASIRGYRLTRELGKRRGKKPRRRDIIPGLVNSYANYAPLAADNVLTSSTVKSGVRQLALKKELNRRKLNKTKGK